MTTSEEKLEVYAFANKLASVDSALMSWAIDRMIAGKTKAEIKNMILGAMVIVNNERESI